MPGAAEIAGIMMFHVDGAGGKLTPGFVPDATGKRISTNKFIRSKTCSNRHTPLDIEFVVRC